MSLSSSICNICVEKFNKSKNIPISCMYCQFESCRKCCETYILDIPLPKCMNTSCGKEWTRKFISENFTKVFNNKTLKSHREQILFEKEKSLLPATQLIIEEQIRKEKILEEVEELEKQINEIRRLQYTKRSEYSKPNKSEKKIFIRACPDQECRGFLSNQWKCGLCEKWTCPDCHIIKGTIRDCEHTCNPDELATAKLLDLDTKACPSCGEGIFKIEGCDQMWCTQCQTAFSWKTGKIETRIHNPHYFEWVRRNGGEIPRNPNDIICGRELDHYLISDITRMLRVKKINSQIIKYVANIIRCTMHVEATHMHRYEVNDVLNNEELRVDYMKGVINEKIFKLKLQQNNKKFEKKREIFEVLQLFKNTVTEIIFRYRDAVRQLYNNNINEIEEYENIQILNEVKVIIEYINECLFNISKTYSSTQLHIVINYPENTGKNNEVFYAVPKPRPISPVS
jgi:hypothetical protein